jgi:hypothetical protein
MFPECSLNVQLLDPDEEAEAGVRAMSSQLDALNAVHVHISNEACAAYTSATLAMTQLRVRSDQITPQMPAIKLQVMAQMKKIRQKSEKL